MRLGKIIQEEGPGRAMDHTSIGSPVRRDIANIQDNREVLGKAGEVVRQARGRGARGMGTFLPLKKLGSKVHEQGCRKVSAFHGGKERNSYLIALLSL